MCCGLCIRSEAESRKKRKKNCCRMGPSFCDCFPPRLFRDRMRRKICGWYADRETHSVVCVFLLDMFVGFVSFWKIKNKNGHSRILYTHTLSPIAVKGEKSARTTHSSFPVGEKKKKKNGKNESSWTCFIMQDAYTAARTAAPKSPREEGKKERKNSHTVRLGKHHVPNRTHSSSGRMACTI